MIRFTAKDDQIGERLDVAAHKNLENKISRSSVKKLLSLGKILVNKLPAKASYKLRPKDKVVINYDPAKQRKLKKIEIPIIYEDKDCLVLNKPAGVLTHSKGEFNPEATVATFLKPYLKKGLEGERAGIVHRLDRGTSGVIICARHPEALKWLQKQFSTRKVKKTYIAIVGGELNPPEAIIDMPIERNPKRPQTFRAHANGKPAQTYYKVLKVSERSGKIYSMVELRPKTGRTHQLRVHLSYIGHPIAGDTLYGGIKADRVFLHAKELELTLLNKERQTFEAPLPTKFNNFKLK